ncbi:transporter, dicarboxylate/amino acid:cation Na+/H+ symporter family protein [Teladorsagia circumcincta]|uniref:Amino acid transporter n=2 Tax=Teladorsagia circumcincta TaxID=45464 RepID=A0A2G9UP85_TELCI|nr:transporter, dicarboxylate/amino acid:cation Na+/H+ symporter family protein [Teladorsagia circumcincta]
MTIVSVVLGVTLGFGLRPLNLPAETLQLINFPGEIFMQVLKMMILPLIFSSLISALAQMDAKESGQMGLATVLYYLTTTVLATLLGIFLVMTIHPGDPSIKAGTLEEVPVDADVSPLDTFLDLVRYNRILHGFRYSNLTTRRTGTNRRRLFRDSGCRYYAMGGDAHVLCPYGNRRTYSTHSNYVSDSIFLDHKKESDVHCTRNGAGDCHCLWNGFRDGNALYEAVAVIFIAQLNNVDLSFAEVLTVRDRVRTSINVLGDGFAAGVVAHILQKRLDVSDARNDFRTEIKEEIGLPLRGDSDRRIQVYFNAITTNANSRIQSRSGSIGNFNLSWRNALLEPGYTPLNKIEDV